jgi:hypothetical protein
LDLNIKPKIPEYKGYIQTTGLQLGKFIKQKELGTVVMSGYVEGKGFDIDELNTNLNANVQKVEYNGVTYRDLSVNGRFDKKMFDGEVRSDDPTLAINFKGKLDLSGKEPAYHITSQLVKLIFKNLVSFLNP